MFPLFAMHSLTIKVVYIFNNPNFYRVVRMINELIHPLQSCPILWKPCSLSSKNHCFSSPRGLMTILTTTSSGRIQTATTMWARQLPVGEDLGQSPVESNRRLVKLKLTGTVEASKSRVSQLQDNVTERDMLWWYCGSILQWNNTRKPPWASLSGLCIHPDISSDIVN